MATTGQEQLGAWVKVKGSLRAGCEDITRACGVPLDFGLLGRWARGKGAPSAEWRQRLSEGGPRIPLNAWERVAPQAVDAPPPVVEAPPVRPAPAPRPEPASEPPAPEPRPQAQTVAELQERIRTIPAELARLSRDVASGSVAITAATIRRQLLEGEARAAKAAIESAGVATVAEVEALRRMLLDATRGCDGCRAKVVAGLKAVGG